MNPLPGAPAINADSSIEWFPLEWVRDQRGLVAGRPDTGRFVLLPVVAEPLLDDLYAGSTPTVAEAAFARTTGRHIDSVTFVSTLAAKGFVRSVDGSPVPAPALRRPSMAGVKPHHLRWIKSPLFLWPFSFATLGGLALGLINGSIAIDPDNYFVFASPLANIVLNIVVPAMLIFLHELAHLFMARAHGQPGRIRVSSRLMFFVAETDVSSVRLVDRTGRLKTYLAGIGLDLFVVASTSSAPYLGSPGLSAAARAASLFLMSGLLMQAACFMRTDVYFVLQDLVRRPNLLSETMTALRTSPVRTLRSNEDPVVRAYSVVVLVGVAGACLWFSTVGLHILVDLVARSVRSIETGWADSDALSVLDGGLSIAVEAALYSFVLLRWSRRLAARMRRRSGPATGPDLSGS